jgi:hypothetical protein
MCCEKEAKKQRDAERMSRHVGAKESAQMDARRMATPGAVVRGEGEETVARESFG